MASMTPNQYKKLISQTSALDLRNNAYLEQLIEMGLIDRWDWWTKQDGKVCDLCASKHGEHHKATESFMTAHPRCRCRPKPHFRDRVELQRLYENDEFKWKEITERHNRVIKSLSTEVKNDLHGFLHKARDRIDDFVRGVKVKGQESYSRVVKNVDSIVGRSHTSQGVTVHQNMSDQVYRSMDIRGEIRPGSVITDVGYRVASPSPVSGVHTIEIQLPTGSRALMTGQYGVNNDVLLPRGARYVVVSHTGDSKKSHTVLRMLLGSGGSSPPVKPVGAPVSISKVKASDFVFERNKMPGDLGAFVTPYSAAEYESTNTALFMTSTGGGGFGLRGDELISVFSKPDAHVGHQMVDYAVKKGAKRLDCLGDFLLDFYRSHGFEVTETIKWDDAYAPEGWDYAKFGRPNVYMMELKK